MLRFFSAITFLFIAIFLEFFLASAGWHFNLVLAVLIACAFALDDFWELLLADLLAVFILNWQPAPSGTLILFAIIPLAAFAFRNLIRPQVWIGTLGAICFGFLIFYVAAAGSQFPSHFIMFLEDIVVGIAAGELVVFAL